MPRDEAASKEGSWGAAGAGREGGTDTPTAEHSGHCWESPGDEEQPSVPPRVWGHGGNAGTEGRMPVARAGQEGAAPRGRICDMEKEEAQGMSPPPPQDVPLTPKSHQGSQKPTGT